MKDFKYDNMILGADERCVVSMNCHETQLNNNVLVVGGSGSGKTMGVVNPMLFSIDNTNIVGIFTKKGVTDLAKKHLEKKGYTVYTMNFTKPENSRFGFDPLQYCRNSADVRALAHSIVYGRQNNTDRPDPFWDNMAESMIYLVFNSVFKGITDRESRAADAVDLLGRLKMYDEKLNDDKKFEELSFDSELNEENERREFYSRLGRRAMHEYRVQAKDADGVDTSTWEKKFNKYYEEKKQEEEKRIDALKERFRIHYELRALKGKDPKGYDVWRDFNEGAETTSRCIAQCVMAVIDTVFNDESVKMLNKSKKQFDFRELAKPKTALFVYTSPVNPSFDGLIAIFYQQLFKCLFEMAEEMENGELDYPVQVICDDFATGARVVDFDKLISIFREKKIAATILIQSLSQLEALYGESKATTIINNCDTQIFLGGMDIRSCQNVADRLNVQDSTIYELPVGRECFIRRGRKPFITDRYDFLKDKAYLSAQKNQDKERSRGN